jgi:hypothetical protein
MSIAEVSESDLFLIIFGWALGFGGQLIVEFFKNRREKKTKQTQAVLDFKSAILRVYGHQILGYKIEALKESYLRRMEIARDSHKKEMFDKMNEMYISTDQRSLDHLSKDQDILVGLNKTIHDCLAILKSDEKFVSWVLNEKISLDKTLKPDFSLCQIDEDVLLELVNYQKTTLTKEYELMSQQIEEINNYLGDKYIGVLIDVSKSPWYLKWFSRIMLRYF